MREPVCRKLLQWQTSALYYDAKRSFDYFAVSGRSEAILSRRREEKVALRGANGTHWNGVANLSSQDKSLVSSQGKSSKSDEVSVHYSQLYQPGCTSSLGMGRNTRHILIETRGYFLSRPGGLHCIVNDYFQFRVTRQNMPETDRVHSTEPMLFN